MCEQTVKKLIDFIEASPSQFHAIENQKQRLLQEGYTQLFESKAWELEAGGKYFVTRNGSSIIAFRIPQEILMDSRSWQATVMRHVLRLRKILK